MTTNTPGSALLPHDPTTWTNQALPYYVTQALSRDPKFAAHDGLVLDERTSAPIKRRCGRATPCAGLSSDRRFGVILERADALHAVHRHYVHANQSLLRFASTARGLFAADLSIDIDAHAKLPEVIPAGWNARTFYVPHLAAAAGVAARLVEWMRDELKLDSRYLTTSASRMGARVTVDWRAFGPRRLWQIAAVIRYAQERVFGGEGLARIAARLGVEGVEVDADVYLKSDLARPDRDGTNTLIGPWLRPLLSLHSKSSNAALWARPMPVPHDRLRPEHAEWLVDVSRGASPKFAIRTGLDPRLAPELRFEMGDALIESAPAPCERLIELFERDDLITLVGADHQEPLQRERLRAAGIPPRPNTNTDREYPDDVIEAVLEALGVDPKRVDEEKWQIVCPRCGLDKRGAKRREGTVFAGSGHVKCFSTNCVLYGGASLHSIAMEHGIGYMLPARAVSSSPLTRMPIGDVPAPTVNEWGPNVEVVTATCATVEEIDAARRKVYEPALSDSTVRIIFDRSPTGTGKTTTVQDMLKERGVRFRVLVPRDEHKDSWVTRVPKTLPIMGRRAEENCDHPDLAEVMSRRESVEKVLCQGCPSKADKSCAYWLQFEDASTQNLALSHQHGMHEVERIRNGSVLDVIDEDPLSSVVSDANIDLDLLELERLKVVAERRHEGDGEGVIVVDLDTRADIERRPSSPAMAEVIRGLQTLLAGDTITSKFPTYAKQGLIADLPLARTLFGDARMRDAVGRLDQAELDTYTAHRESLREATRRTEFLGVYLPNEIATAWRAPGLNPIEDCLAGLAWQEPLLQPLPAATRDRATIEAYRRPPDIMRALRDALSGLLRTYETGYSGTSSLQAFREGRSSTWTLRLTQAKPILDPKEQPVRVEDRDGTTPAKLVVLSATMTAERARLALGAPSSSARWVVFEPVLARREERIVIADKLYGKATLKKAGAETLRAEVYEAIDKIIATEWKRTGLPVAVIGPGEAITAYVEHRLGQKLPRELRMPLRGGSDRATRLSKLHDLTRPLGFLPGYSFGVSGSNAFKVEGIDGGKERYVRALVMIASPIPNLSSVARDHRGLYADDLSGWDTIDHLIGLPVRPGTTPVDWTPTWRTVAFEGTENGGTVLTSRNVPGYVDARANAILHGLMQGEIVQILGRLRSIIGDGLSRAYMFCGVPIEGMAVDRVLTLDELRADLGLAVAPTRARGPAPTMTLNQRVTERGRLKTVRWLAKGMRKRGDARDGIETAVRIMFEREGLGFTRADREALRAALAEE